MFSPRYNQTSRLGGSQFKSVFMPAKPAVGLPAGIKMPDDAQNYCRIVEAGITSLRTSFHTFNNCIEAHCDDEDPDETEVTIFCQGIGIVRQDDEAYPEKVLDLRDYGTSADTRTVVIPLSD